MFGVIAISSLLCYAFSSVSHIQPGSALYDHGLVHTPGLAQWLQHIQPIMLPLMIGLHGVEVVYMERTRLSKHRVPRFSSLWWKWIFATFVEGLVALRRFDKIVEGEEAKKT